MKDPKFFAFAGGLGVVVVGLLVGAYYFDFAPKSPHPSGDSFVSGPTTPIARPVSQPIPQSFASAPVQTSARPVSTPETPRPVPVSTHRAAAQSAPKPAIAKALKTVDQQLGEIHQELRILTVEQSRMDQRLIQLRQAREATSSIPASAPLLPTTARSLRGWSVESIGDGQAWIQGPSGNTHVVQAGMALDGFHVLAVEPDRVLTSRGTIGY
jgi:hypothetical protein